MSPDAAPLPPCHAYLCLDYLLYACWLSTTQKLLLRCHFFCGYPRLSANQSSQNNRRYVLSPFVYIPVTSIHLDLALPYYTTKCVLTKSVKLSMLPNEWMPFSVLIILDFSVVFKRVNHSFIKKKINKNYSCIYLTAPILSRGMQDLPSLFAVCGI